MPKPRTRRFGRGRSIGVAESHTRTVLTRGRVLVVALIVALVSVPMVASAQSTNDRIAQTRSEIDAAAQRWFASREEAAQLDAQIAELEHKVADAKQHADTTAVAATARAVEIYKGSGTDLGPVLSSGSALDSVRRATLLDRANAESERVIDEFTQASEALASQRAALEQRRADQATLVEKLGAEQAALEAQLAGLQTQAQRESAAAAQAAAAKAAAANRSKAATAAPKAATKATTKKSTQKPVGPAVVAPPPSSGGGGSHHDDPFLVCTRARESHGNYGVVSASGKYFGAYQFALTTWDITASHAGRVDLVGVRPNQASVSDQDDLAWALYQWQGKGPWGGRC
jgi:peptidoglycan hydrolase CwlO-like protein